MRGPRCLSAATTSAAVDKLIDAVGALRYEQLEEAGAGRHGQGRAEPTHYARVLQSRPDNLIRIDGLQQYAAELNTTQGVGFTFFKKRMDKQWVVAAMIKGLCIIVLASAAGVAVQTHAFAQLLGAGRHAAAGNSGNGTDTTVG